MEVGTFCEEERGLTAYDGLSEGVQTRTSNLHMNLV